MASLRVTYTEDYYSPLVEDLQVTVRIANQLKGKALFSKSDFTPGDVVLSERQCVAIQNLDDKLEGIPACGGCLCSLETVMENVTRVRASLYRDALEAREEEEEEDGETPPPGNEGGPISPPPLPPLKETPQLPHPNLMPVPTIVPCVGVERGCIEKYCSVACRDWSWRHHHGILCPSHRPSLGPEDPLQLFLNDPWIQGGVNFSDTFHVAFAVISIVMSSIRMAGLSLDEAWRPFSHFISAPWEDLSFEFLLTATDEDDDDDDDSGSKEDVLARAAGLFEKIFEPTNNESEFLFGPTFLSRLVGMVLLNGQDRSPPSPFMQYKQALRSEVGEEGVVELLQRLLEEIPDADPEGLNLSSKGQGIYCVGACMNHSCSPNVAVGYCDDNDETLHVTAVKEIKAGDELFISYIDETDDREQRQTQLYHHYLFDCRCPQCVSEMNGGVQLEFDDDV